MAFIGETCRKRYQFTAENIRSVAASLGDSNPLHHDSEVAARSRFGRLIAAAGHSTGVLVSVLAEHYTQGRGALGLEFQYRLRRAVPEGLDAVMTWRVTAKEPAAKLGGDILAVEGEMTDDAGVVYVSGSGRLLVMADVP